MFLNDVYSHNIKITTFSVAQKKNGNTNNPILLQCVSTECQRFIEIY